MSESRFFSLFPADEEEDTRPRRRRHGGRSGLTLALLEEAEKEDRRERGLDLRIIGKPCMLFEDPETALLLHSEKHMMAPFPGDPGLTVDRFDGRTLLGDRKAFMKPAGLKAEAARLGEVLLPSELETFSLEELNEERYRDLWAAEEEAQGDEDEEMDPALRQELRRERELMLEEEARKRRVMAQRGSHMFAFTYDEQEGQAQGQEGGAGTAGDAKEERKHPDLKPGGEHYSDSDAEAEDAGPPPLEKPDFSTAPSSASSTLPTSLSSASLASRMAEGAAAKQEEGTAFRPSWEVPSSITTLPSSLTEHLVLEKTAHFVRDAGPQGEIVLKVKQASNPKFAFLDPDHPLHPYYAHIRETGVKHQPPAPPPAPAAAAVATAAPGLSALASYEDGDDGRAPTGIPASSFPLLASLPPPPPHLAVPPPDMLQVMEKMLPFVRKNGAAFEDMVRSREGASTRFAFLRPGTTFHPFYQWALAALAASSVAPATTVGATTAAAAGSQQQQQQQGATAIPSSSSSTLPPVGSSAAPAAAPSAAAGVAAALARAAALHASLLTTSTLPPAPPAAAAAPLATPMKTEGKEAAPAPPVSFNAATAAGSPAVKPEEVRLRRKRRFDEGPGSAAAAPIAPAEPRPSPPPSSSLPPAVAASASAPHSAATESAAGEAKPREARESEDRDKPERDMSKESRHGKEKERKEERRRKRSRERSSERERDKKRRRRSRSTSRSRQRSAARSRSRERRKERSREGRGRRSDSRSRRSRSPRRR